jgi:hypothetical protein
VNRREMTGETNAPAMPQTVMRAEPHSGGRFRFGFTLPLR